MVLPGYERSDCAATAVISAARQSGAPAVFIADSHRPNVRRDREFLKRTPHWRRGLVGARVIDDPSRAPTTSSLPSAAIRHFFNTDLDSHCKTSRSTP